MSNHEPPLGKELSGIRVPSPWPGEEASGSESPEPEPPEVVENADLARLRREVRQLRAALEDIVAFALASADYKERAITMHRRAVAALTQQPLPDAGDSTT
jgi:hypothetical protein